MSSESRETTRQDASRVIIFDTTLRDGEQSPGCSMNLEEKLQVADVLQELKVQQERTVLQEFQVQQEQTVPLELKAQQAQTAHKALQVQTRR